MYVVCTSILFVPVYVVCTSVLFVPVYCLYQYIVCTSVLFVPVYCLYQYIVCTSVWFVPDRYLGTSGQHDSNSTYCNMQAAQQNTTSAIQTDGKAFDWLAPMMSGLRKAGRGEIASQVVAWAALAFMAMHPNFAALVGGLHALSRDTAVGSELIARLTNDYLYKFAARLLDLLSLSDASENELEDVRCILRRKLVEYWNACLETTDSTTSHEQQVASSQKAWVANSQQNWKAIREELDRQNWTAWLTK